jgi:hypothetical protein
MSGAIYKKALPTRKTQKNNIVDKSKQKKQKSINSPRRNERRKVKVDTTFFSKSPSSVGVEVEEILREESLLEVRKRAKVSKSDESKESQDEISSLLLEMCEQICAKYGLPSDRARKAAKKAARTLLADKYIVSLTLPDKPPAKWFCRSEDDHRLNPIEFQEKYWGIYIEEGILFQSDLRRLDNSLFGAVKGYCKYRGLDPNDYLPLPARKKVRSDTHVLNGGQIDTDLEPQSSNPTKPKVSASFLEYALG